MLQVIVWRGPHVKNHVFEEKHNFITVLQQNKLAFNSYNAYLWSTLDKNNLKYLYISIWSKNLIKGSFLVLHPNFPIIWYVKYKTPNFKVLFFSAIWISKKNGLLQKIFSDHYFWIWKFLNWRKTLRKVKFKICPLNFFFVSIFFSSEILHIFHHYIMINYLYKNFTFKCMQVFGQNLSCSFVNSILS